MTAPISPYHVPGFYADALAKGRHRDIVGGRWDETGRVQMDLLVRAGLKPDHHLLDIGAGSLRLGCKVLPYLDPGHYWATDKSRALMLAGHRSELADPGRLPPDQLVEDEEFRLPGVPDHITHAICFGVFTHLPLPHLQLALPRIAARLPALQALIFTTFLAPEPPPASHRQPDGVVTHRDRPPYHFALAEVTEAARTAGFDVAPMPVILPRGQVALLASPGQFPPEKPFPNCDHTF